MIRKFIFAATLMIGATSAQANMDVEGMWRNHALPQSMVEESSGPAIPREIVPFGGDYAKGTIIVNSAERRLYFVLGDGKAMRYGIGVGRPGFDWTGEHRISAKREWPDWRPPAAMLKRRPDLPTYMPGGEGNPLGARAMYLGSSIYRIHGSNEPDSIGHAVSSGCIRMLNDDVVDLYQRVGVGTRVVVR
jgi:lipoprotein-anchoring transpeptidase ErfK/SrfK